MPIVELLVSSTAGVVVKFLLEQVKEYKENRSKGAKTSEEEIEKLKNSLEPFKEIWDIDENELRSIKDNVRKLSEKLKENGFDVTDEAYKKWIMEFLDNKLKGIKQDKSTFKIELWTERVNNRGIAMADSITSRDITIREKKYKVGDRIVLYFKSERDCYLTLLNIGTSSKLTVLLPNSLSGDNFIRANKTYSIPAEGSPFDYELSGPPGIEKIKAIAITSRHDLLDIDFSENEVFHSADSSVAPRDVSIVAKRMENIPENSWADFLYEFEVI